MSEPSLIETGVDALSTEFAVLDSDGEIVYTNESWRQFAQENTSETLVSGDFVGVNYLDVTKEADDEHAQQTATGLDELLAGEREEFTMEYPCHAPDEDRWFLLRATSFEHEGEAYVLVTHQNITDRKTAEIDARQRNDRLETVASVLSHDLRNPLAVAIGFVEMLQQDTEDGRLDRVASALERMETIISDALVLARYDTVEEMRVVDLETIVERAWANVATENATLEVPETVLFRADPDLLDHILENLFRNAVEHAGTDATVEVGALDDGFYVADDGPGIPESERECVFERGFTIGGEGTGLGLDIVAQIADAHGWDVSVSESEAGGARFEFTGVDLDV